MFHSIKYHDIRCHLCKCVSSDAQKKGFQVPGQCGSSRGHFFQLQLLKFAPIEGELVSQGFPQLVGTETQQVVGPFWLVNPECDSLIKIHWTSFSWITGSATRLSSGIVVV
jgi:hypothetical protein